MKHPQHEPPNQYDTERLLSDSLSHGDKSRLAAFIGVSLSEVAQQWNPDDPKKSDYFRFKRTLYWLATEVNEDAARVIVADLLSSMDAWVGNVRADNIAHLTAGMLKEAAEVGAAQIENSPAHVFRKEVLDVRAKADELLAAVDRRADGKLREAGK